MKFRYTALFSIKGLSLPPAEGEKTLVVDAAVEQRAFLTSQPDTYAFEGDRSLAVAGLMMKALFESEATGNEIKQRVSSAVEEIRAARQKEFGSSPFLIFIGEGEVPSFNSTHERDAEDFIVCLDGVDKDEIRARFRDTLTALLISIISEAEGVNGIRKVTDSTVFFQENGKPVYSYTFSMGSATAYISRPLLDDQVQAIGELYRLLAVDTTFQRVQELIISSFEIDDDTHRSFIDAWLAFEIFVNKVFATYKKGKYSLGYKFAAVSSQLSPNSCDKDLKTMRLVNKVRNKLYHGESVDEASLPVKSIRDLASKYLRLHLEHDHPAKG